MDRTHIVFGILLLAIAIRFSISWKIILFSAFLYLLNVFMKSVGWLLYSNSPNPFAQDSRKPRKPYIADTKLRDAVIKQAFQPNKVLGEKWDAIVIGSGMGGLTVASILAKTGKKVLVLEQHDQSGGCCHTFIDKGYEFDVGIHYIGEVGEGRLNKTLIEQISDGQIEWKKMEDAYDIVSIGYEKDNIRKYPMVSDTKAWASTLKEHFPDEHKGIDGFIQLMDEYGKGYDDCAGLCKLLPLPLSNILIKLGLFDLINKKWANSGNETTKDVIESLTTNKDLQTILAYSWGDYGSPPHKTHFGVQAMMIFHFTDCGGYYPIGGASEIALNMIPVIERAGGKVLVRAKVDKILCTSDGKACGVRVEKGNEHYEIKAPVVISNAGVYNTFQTLLPKEVSQKSYFSDIAASLKPGYAGISVFVGLNKNGKELGLKAQNTWAFRNENDCLKVMVDEFMEADSIEDVMDKKVPLLFISFPSEKDPNWSTTHPERKDKSTVAIVTLGKWEWFSQWVDEPLKRRGDDYEAIKKTLGHTMVEQACSLYPQIRDHIDYVDIGTPVTNAYYIAAPHGEIYGLDHTKTRMSPEMTAKLRPETDVPGLFMTGQDAMMCGFTGALFGGVLCASQVLRRNVMGDIEKLHAKLK